MDNRLKNDRTSENLPKKDEGLRQCLAAARRLLICRPRSEAEIRERLLKRGFEEQIVEKALERLKNLGALDDAAFARAWREDRNTFKPRSQRLLKMELRQKGVAAEVIAEVVAQTDDKANAASLALRKGRSLPVADYRLFRQKLGAYLQRRGFDYRVIEAAVKEAWLERTQAAAPDEEDNQ